MWFVIQYWKFLVTLNLMSENIKFTEFDRLYQNRFQISISFKHVVNIIYTIIKIMITIFSIEHTEF